MVTFSAHFDALWPRTHEDFVLSSVQPRWLLFRQLNFRHKAVHATPLTLRSFTEDVNCFLRFLFVSKLNACCLAPLAFQDAKGFR